jgi:hypothetical protein
MTIDEHMGMRYALMNVRDELADLTRRDPHLRHYVEDVEYCLAVLRRPHVLRTLHPDAYTTTREEE